MLNEAILTLMVSDMDRSVRFYTETLGLKLVANYGGHWAEVQTTGVRIGLHPGGKGANAGGHMSLGFRVDDLDVAQKDLVERGVKFLPARPDKGSRQAHFADPDGTPLYLIEIKWG